MSTESISPRAGIDMFLRHLGTLERNNIFSSLIQAAAPTQQLADDEVRKVFSNRCIMFTEQ